MADFHITPFSSLKGNLIVPPSKSQTLRALIFAALAKGKSCIESYLDSPDTQSMINAISLLGALVHVEKEKKRIWVEGCNGRFKPAENIIDCGNSGLVLRFIGSLAGLIPSYTILTGDESIRKQRPAQPLLEGLSGLGAFAVSSKGDDYAPLIIKGPFTREKTSLDGKDSQPVSGLLIAGSFAPHSISIEVKNPGEKPWIDLTLDWLKRLDIPFNRKDYTFYELKGNSSIKDFFYQVPGDLSTLAFPIASALVTNSELNIENVDLNDMQGDKKLIFFLQEMGAKFDIDPVKKTFRIKKGSKLEGKKIDLNDCIDALPILSVIGCFCEGPTEIINAEIARKKESDRISTITKELKKMGALIEEKQDGLIIHPSTLKGAHLNSHSDHRIAMSLSVAAFAAKGMSTIQDVDCIAKTYPGFVNDFSKIGAKINVL